MNVSFQWKDHGYESFAWLVVDGRRTKASARVGMTEEGRWAAEVEWLYWSGHVLEEEFPSLEEAKSAAETFLSKWILELAASLKPECRVENDKTTVRRESHPALQREDRHHLEALQNRKHVPDS